MQGHSHDRKAFTFGSVLGRQDGVRITSIAVDSDSQRLFLGLSNGQVEEHQLLHGATGSVPTCRLLSERRISRHAEVADLCCLPVALCLVVRTDDGAVHLAGYETSALHQLPSTKGSHATLVAGDAMRAPARLAVVLRSSSVLGKAARVAQVGAAGPVYSSKILVYAVASGPGGISHSAQPAHLLARVTIHEPVLDIAWVKDGILAAVPGGYQLIQSGCKVMEVAAGVTTRTLLASCQPIRQAVVLFADVMLLLVDSMGAAIREPILLPDKPVAAALTPAFVVAVTDDAILVFDSSNCQLVQQVAFAHDDAWVAASARLPCIQDSRSGALLMATSTEVLCLQPVELEQQVWELLKQHRYHQAILLTRSAMAAKEAWAGPAMAQAGLLLLRAMRVPEAMEAFAACEEDTWQPASLLALFPSVTGRWLADAPPAKPYWGLHGPGPLQSLTHICNHYLDSHKARHPNQHPQDAEALLTTAKAHIASYILKVRERPGVLCLEALDTLAVVLLCESSQTDLLEAVLSSGPASAPAAAANAAAVSTTAQAAALPLGSAALPDAGGIRDGLHAEASSSSAIVGMSWSHDDEVAAGAASMHTHASISSTLPAVGTAARKELAAAAAASVARLPCTAALRESVRALESASRWHALALLRAARKHVEEALAVWRNLCEGQLQEPASPSGAVTLGRSPQAVAVAAAGALLLDAELVPTAALTQQLPWLLAFGPQQALTLLRRRNDLGLEAAFALLEGHTGDVRWEYLQHLVYERGMDDAALQTELALELVECIQRVVQSLRQEGLQAMGDDAASQTAGSGQVEEAESCGHFCSDARLPDLDSCLAAIESYCRAQQGAQLQRRQQGISASQLASTHSWHNVSLSPGAGAGAPWSVQQAITSGQGQGMLPSTDAVRVLLAAVQPDKGPTSTSQAPSSEVHVPRLLRLRTALLMHLHRSLSYDPEVVLAALGPLPPPPLHAEQSLQQEHTAAARAESSAWDESLQMSSSSHRSYLEQQGHLAGIGEGPSGTLMKQQSLGIPKPELDRGQLLLRERVLLLSRLGDHAAALALLAFRMADIDACIAYCRQQTLAIQQQQQEGRVNGVANADAADDGQEGDGTPNASWLVLLELLLNPGSGRQPLYAAAVRVLHEEGGNLSPLQVLAALPDSMPLHVAVEQLNSMLAGVMHRRRHTQVIRGLHRARNLTVRAELAQLSCQRVLITEDSTCHACHRLLLDKVVYGFPSGGMLLCARCAKPTYEQL